MDAYIALATRTPKSNKSELRFGKLDDNQNPLACPGSRFKSLTLLQLQYFALKLQKEFTSQQRLEPHRNE